MEERFVDPAVLFDIDAMVLEYLIFMAMKNLLENHEERDVHQKIDHSLGDPRIFLQMVDCQFCYLIEMDIVASDQSHDSLFSHDSGKAFRSAI